MTENLLWAKTTLRPSWQRGGGCWRVAGWRLTLLQVLLVVPRLFLFGYEFLHCPRAQHGKAKNDGPLCENNGAPAGWLLQQGQGASSRRSCGEAVSGPGEAVLWLCLLFCVHSHVSSAHLPTGAHPGASQHRRGSSGAATAALPPLSAVRSRCVKGRLRNGNAISHPTEFDVLQ